MVEALPVVREVALTQGTLNKLKPGGGPHAFIGQRDWRR